MASLTEEIADALARDALRAAEELGDENLITEVSRVIGASSTTTQEAFTTFVRIRMSEQRARRLLAEKVGAEWPLQLATPGAVAVQMMAPAPVVAAHPAPIRAPAPLEPPKAPPRVAEAPVAPEVLEVEVPVLEEPQPSAMSAFQEEAVPLEAETQPVEAGDASLIRPRLPGATPKPVAKPVQKSIEAALLLATSLPRKPMPQPERTYTAEPLVPGLEVPDGDWG